MSYCLRINESKLIGNGNNEIIIDFAEKNERGSVRDFFARKKTLADDDKKRGVTVH